MSSWSSSTPPGSSLAASSASAAARLLPGGVLLLQLLNYERIRDRVIRHLPLNFRDDPAQPGGEVVFLRLMTLDGPRHVRFNPLTLALHPGSEPPVELKGAREVRLRTWNRAELTAVLAEAGFAAREIYGDMEGGSYEAQESTDLVMVAELRAPTG